MRFVLCVACISILLGCKSGQSGTVEPVNTVEPGDDTLAGDWVRSCSPVDDTITEEVLSDAGMLPLWWVEQLEITSQGFSVVRTLYADDACSTPFTNPDDEPVVLMCEGSERETYLVQDTYDVTSLIHTDSSGIPDIPGTCDLPSEPALNVFPSGDVLYRAYYTDDLNGDPPDLVVNFNEEFERLE